MTKIVKGKDPFRPYARLISILGDQLISDKWVGVLELVKNCYDADAEHVKVCFQGFSESTNLNKARHGSLDLFSNNEEAQKQKELHKPKIIIEDDGHGMPLEVVRNVWMRPATPNKLNKKKSKNITLRYTKRGRVMQGDKGVGRFAIYKLGNKITLYTKAKGEPEVKVSLDFSSYANDDFNSDTDHQDKLLSQIENNWETTTSPEYFKNGCGTAIIIQEPRYDWAKSDLKKLYAAFTRMTPPNLPELNLKNDWEVQLEWEQENVEFKETINVEELLEDSHFKFSGNFDNNSNKLVALYEHFGKSENIEVDLFNHLDPEVIQSDLTKLKLFKDEFTVLDPEDEKIRLISKTPIFGSFKFNFHAYDLRNPDLKTYEKDYLKENSVYLYRDKVRVYPYGELGNDWLQLSRSRGELKAGHYFSYNDLLGFIFITQEENSILRDAADREGLIDDKGARTQFVAVVQAILKIMKDRVDSDKKRDTIKKIRDTINLEDGYNDKYSKLLERVYELNDPVLIQSCESFNSAKEKYVDKLKTSMQITQDLAATGMAVEKATHDTLALLNKLKKNTKDILDQIKKNAFDIDQLEDFLKDLSDDLTFLHQEIQILTPLTRKARRVTKDVSIHSTALRVSKYFGNDLKDQIQFSVTGEDFVIKTNIGLMLQLFLNLSDNSIYWLNKMPQENREIIVHTIKDTSELIFADNGPGIPEGDEDIIFEEFISRKSEGRGLGLYIVRELLTRINAEISVISDPDMKILPGANFRVKFN